VPPSVNGRAWTFADTDDLSGLTLTGNASEIDRTEDGKVTFGKNTISGELSYSFPLELSNNKDDFVIDFRFKYQHNGPRVFAMYENQSNMLFGIYMSNSDYWRWLSGSQLIRINHPNKTPSRGVYGRYTILYKYSDHKFIMYYNGEFVTFTPESPRINFEISQDNHALSILVKDKSSFNDTTYNISFGHVHDSGLSNFTTFDHMYYDIGGTYTDEQIKEGFV
jgi:hypothetical protein